MVGDENLGFVQTDILHSNHFHFDSIPFAKKAPPKACYPLSEVSRMVDKTGENC